MIEIIVSDVETSTKILFTFSADFMVGYRHGVLYLNQLTSECQCLTESGAQQSFFLWADCVFAVAVAT